MKNILLLVALLTSPLIHSQPDLNKSEVITSQVEYTFLTQTYPYADEVVMLPGYEFKEFMNITAKKFNFQYKLLIHSESKEIRATLIIITKYKSKKDKKRYLCLPINNVTLFKDFYNQMLKLGPTSSMALEAISTTLLAKFIDNKYNFVPPN